MRVLFGSLKTDQPDLLNGELEAAENCIPYVQSYGPFPQPVAYSARAAALVKGAYSTKDLSGNVYTFLGTEKILYKESLTALNDISRTATYAVATDKFWEFETFGNTILAVNGTDAMQVFTMGTSTRFLNQSASASAPIAAHIAVVRDFVVTGNQPNLENRIQWSRINNPLRFDISQRFQSDYQDLPGNDHSIKRITGGDFGAIFTNSSVWRMTYVGAPLIFRFDEVGSNIGCKAAGSVARFQGLSFFLGNSGMYVFDGQTCNPIGVEQVDEKILGELNNAFVDRITSTIDPVNKLYLMAYPSTASTDGTCNRIAIYSWPTQRWTFVSENLEYLFNHMSGGYTLEGLDTFGSIDALAFSLDSAAWQGGLSALSCVNENHQIARFEGSSKTARFITGESQIVTDARAFIRSLRPLVQGNSDTTVTCRIGGRDRLIDSVTYSTASVMNSLGTCPVRSNSRYHRIRMDVAGGFERVMGTEVELTKEGRR